MWFKNATYVRVVATCMLIYAMMLLFAWLTPPAADDFSYGYGSSFSFKDIIALEVKQYFNWTGRSVAHLIARCLLSAPQAVAVLLLPMVTVLLLVLSMLVVLGKEWKEQLRAWHIITTFGLLWFFIPAFGSVFFWITGAANYLWTLVFCVAFLVPLRFLYDSEVYMPPRWLRLSYPFLGLLAGWSQESICGLGGLGALVMILLLQRRNTVVPAWLWLGTAGGILGAALLLLAPGNAVRAGSPFFAAFYAQAWHEQILGFLSQYMQVQWGMAPLYGVMLLSFWLLRDKGPRFTKGEWGVFLAFLLMSQATLGVLLFAPSIPLRTLTGTFFFCIIAVMFLLARLVSRVQVLVRGMLWYRIVALCGVCLLVTSVGVQGRLFWAAHAVFLERDRLLQSEASAVALPPYSAGNKYFFINSEIADVGIDSTGWVNVAHSQAYSKERIVLKVPPRSEQLAFFELGGERLSVEAWGKSMIVVRSEGKTCLGKDDIWLARAHAPLTLRSVLQYLVEWFAGERYAPVMTDRKLMKMRFALTICPYSASSDSEGWWICQVPDFAQGKEMMLGIDKGNTCEYRDINF